MNQAVLAALAIFAQSIAPPAERGAEPALPVADVRVLDTVGFDVLPGAIRPCREVTLGSPFDTLLASMSVQEGDRVTAGEMVALLDDRVTRAALMVAEFESDRSAQIERAEAGVRRAKDTLDRIRTAINAHAASETEFIAAESEYRIARADLEYAIESRRQAELNAELAKARLEEHHVRAPFDAVVIRVHAEPGSMLSPGEPIMELISVDALCVDLHLPAAIASGLAPGERFALDVLDPVQRTVTATIRYIEPRIDSVSRTMRVVFDFDESASAGLVSGSLVVPASERP